MFFIPLLSFENGIIVNKFQTLLLSIHNSGVMRFDEMSHRKRRGRRLIKQSNGRHGGTVGA